MSTWFAERVIDLVGAISDAYYTRKYGMMARRLGRPRIALDQQRGFIIIQIDGFSHEHLIQAIAAGHMPYLGRLLASRRLVVSPWRCGIPSTTPAVQAGIMFGNRFDIPGFRWYEKDRERGILAKLPDSMRIMRARVSSGRRGILSGGSCYVSMLDGDADLALFTLSTLHRQRFFESVRGMGLFLLFFLSLFRITRVAWLVLTGYLGKLSRRLVALVRPSVENPFDVFSPFLQALSETLFTEVQTFGVMLDIYRCAPAIYANYTIYDDVIHKAGLDHKAAFQTLRAIDKRIRQIDRMRARYRKHQYDLYVISDHGNTPAVPFSWLNGMSLARFIATQVGQELAEERIDAREHWVDKAHYLADELRGLEESSSRPRLRRALAAVRRYVDRRVLDRYDLDYDLTRQQDVVVSASGPLAHVYFKVSPRQLDLIEVAILYPHLLDALLAAPGVGALVGRAEGRTVVLGSEGGSLVIEEDGERVEEPHPLAQFGDATYASDQLHYLTHFPHSGDLIMLGAMGTDGKVVAFEEQVATHGGMGGPQIHPFIARSPECPLTPEALDDAVDLYPYFMRRYQRHSFPEDLAPEDGAEEKELVRDVAAKSMN
ncbi:MAG: alkaline phosphatase family protein [Anaerolineae bacterium]|jgi:hypothetical protein